MTFRQKSLVSALALLVMGSTAAQAASSAAVNREFRSAVARVLESVRKEQDFLRQMSSNEFRDFVSCAQRVMDGAPLTRKQYVLAAKGMSAQRQRFDEVALDNRAKLKQQITRECAN